MSSRLCRAPSSLHSAALSPHPGWGLCLGLSLIKFSGVSGEEAVIHSGGASVPAFLKGTLE